MEEVELTPAANFPVPVESALGRAPIIHEDTCSIQFS